MYLNVVFFLTGLQGSLWDYVLKKYIAMIQWDAANKPTHGKYFFYSFFFAFCLFKCCTGNFFLLQITTQYCTCIGTVGSLCVTLQGIYRSIEPQVRAGFFLIFFYSGQLNVGHRWLEH